MTIPDSVLELVRDTQRARESHGDCQIRRQGEIGRGQGEGERRGDAAGSPQTQSRSQGKKRASVTEPTAETETRLYSTKAETV